MPRAFRGEQPIGPQPGDIEEYKAKSMYEEYRPLTIVFGILALALGAYFIKSILWGHKLPPLAPPPAQSVYIDMLPPKGPTPTPR